MRLISISGVDVRLGGKAVLVGLDVVIERGEIVTVVGLNGSGKSTLLRLIIGAVSPSAGHVDRRAGLNIGYVPQRFHIDRTMPMTVNRFINLPARQPATKCAAALARVGATNLGQRQMAELSGGQLQRVLLARALVTNPALLLLDEPTQGLDQPGSASFYQLMEATRNDLGCAILLVSHELHVVMSATDRVICLNGRVCCQGKPEAVSNAPEYRALFGDATHGTPAHCRHVQHHQHESVAVLQ